VIAERFRPDWLPVVEESNNVRATVCAVSGTNTSVVYLNVQAFRVVVGGINRANGLTRRVLTVLTHDRDEPSFSVREVAFPVSFNTNPGDRSSSLDTVLCVDWNIVFCLTCDYDALQPMHLSTSTTIPHLWVPNSAVVIGLLPSGTGPAYYSWSPDSLRSPRNCFWYSWWLASCASCAVSPTPTTRTGTPGSIGRASTLPSNFGTLTRLPAR